jgi:carbamoylphosphate synthase large subunit
MLLPAPSKKHVVLIGSAGTATAFGAVSALRRHWSTGVTVVAMDINPEHLVTTSLLSDAFEQVPVSADSKFPSALLKILGKYGVDTYLPLIDLELARAAELRDSSYLPEDLCLLAPPAQSAHICFDKYLAASWMQQQGIPSPVTALASQPFEADAYFLKPRKGVGSQGVKIIEPAQLTSMPPGERGDWIVQGICQAPEVTVDVFYDPAREFMRISCRERLETKVGVCTKARVFFNPELAEIAASLSKGLQLVGTYCFQVMRVDSGWGVTDINARPGGGTAMSVAVGLDFHAAHFARAWGMDARGILPQLSHERIVTRQYTEFVMV